MKILITSATRYIGYKLTMEAVRRKYTVHVLVRDLQTALLTEHPNIIKFKGDITDKSMRESKTINNPVIFSINPLKTAV